MSTKSESTKDRLKQLLLSIVNGDNQNRNSLTPLEKLAVKLTEYVGSIGFFLIIFAWTIVWLGWNTIGPVKFRFDEYPAFVLWLFLSNVIQIFLMPLIMVGQNLQGQYAEHRAQTSFELSVKAEKEIEAVLNHLEHQNSLILTILTEIRDRKGSE